MPHGKLLILDDDPSICESLRIIADSCGYQSSTVSTVENFYDQYKVLNPEIITLELNLGQEDGVELFRWLAKCNSKAKIILVSGYDEKVLHSAQLLGRSHDLNIIAALHKPIDIKQLKSILLSEKKESVEITQASLKSAIENQHFMLFYQPKMEIQTQKLVGVEALLRWQLKKDTVISPNSFVEFAENNDLIEALSSMVNHLAIRECAEFHKQGLNIQMSINISPKLLRNLSLPDELFEIAKQHHCDPEKICLEITETAAMEYNSPHYLDILTRFRIKGFSVSIDDFGTGYSTLIELHRTPCNELKIDKSFVLNLKRDTPDYIIVRAVINLGHDFGMKIVAEGIESIESFDILKELGCDIAQGYYIAHPMPAEKLLRWAKEFVDSDLIVKLKK
jgi:EAL domain-containing protein (putative c-di-GMP-specific phosphodiesterase class I)